MSLLFQHSTYSATGMHQPHEHHEPQQPHVQWFRLCVEGSWSKSRMRRSGGPMIYCEEEISLLQHAPSPTAQFQMLPAAW